jgi:hypothetical protein
MTVINLDRDQFWADPIGAKQVTWAKDTSSGFNGNGVVYPKIGFVRSTLSPPATSSGEWCLVGCCLDTPTVDDYVPFSVRGFSNTDGANQIDLMVVGGVASPTNGWNALVSPLMIGREGAAGVVNLPPISDTPWAGMKLGFAIGFVAGQNLNPSIAYASMSVQNLVSKPDSYATAVS